MNSYGQKRLNIDDVRRGTRMFILSFVVLVAFSFLTVFLFFKSAQMQNKEMRTELDSYHNMLGRNELLRIKLDTIYKKMNLLSTDKVQNDIFLRNSIIEDIAVGRQLVGNDSADHLKPYNMLLKNMQPMLIFKNDLIKIKIQEKAAARNLQECINSMGQVSTRTIAKTKSRGRLFK